MKNKFKFNINIPFALVVILAISILFAYVNNDEHVSESLKIMFNDTLKYFSILGIFYLAIKFITKDSKDKD